MSGTVWYNYDALLRLEDYRAPFYVAQSYELFIYALQAAVSLQAAVYLCVAWKRRPRPIRVGQRRVLLHVALQLNTLFTGDICRTRRCPTLMGRGLLFSGYWRCLAISSISIQRSLAASSTITDSSVVGPRYTNCFATYFNAGYPVARFTSFSVSRVAHVALLVYLLSKLCSKNAAKY